MNPSEYIFSEHEIQQLEKYRDNQENSQLKMRFIALIMLAKGFDITNIASVLGKSIITIERWLHLYLEKGIDGLNSFNYKSKKAYLTFNQINQVIIWVTCNNPETIKETRAYISDKFGISYSLEAVRNLLKRHGLKRIRPKTIPGNAPDEKEQREFIEKYNKMKAESEPGTKILFVDAMHLVHQAIAGNCWGDPQFPPILETNSGRKRLNILGAYSPLCNSFIHLTGEENCNANRAIEFLELIRDTYTRAPLIQLIADNAPYFYSKKVRQWLEENKRIKIEFLPTYSPNLNLIERLWRFVKDKLVRNKYHKEFKTFRAKVFQLLNNLKDYRNELKPLMIEKFEIVKAQFVPVHT